MRLVVSGYYGFGNAGDEAILAALIADLRRREPNLELVVISGDPAQTSRRHGVRAIGRGLVDTIQALMRSDGLVSGGGGLLQDRTSTQSLLYYAGVMLLAAALRRPVYVYAQGIGPVEGRLGRAVAGLALRRATYVSVRDQGSLDAARSLGAGDVEVAADPAIGLGPPTSRVTRTRPSILVAVRPAPRWVQIEDEFVTALRKLGESHRLAFVAMHPAQDGPLATRLAARVGPYAIVADYADLDELMGHIGSAELVIGMRLHALILAATAGVPFVAVSYDPKVDAFAASVQQPVAGSVSGSLTADALVRLARSQLSADTGAYRARVAELALRAQRPADAIVAALHAARPSA
ncbi:MAG: polysaccharide pyruvyl transferase CsaB [Candidatus Limnocylindria bacterium]